MKKKKVALYIVKYLVMSVTFGLVSALIEYLNHDTISWGEKLFSMAAFFIVLCIMAGISLLIHKDDKQ